MNDTTKTKEEQLIYDSIGIDVSKKSDYDNIVTDKKELMNLIFAAKEYHQRGMFSIDALEPTLFAAYLTGQMDVRNRQDGLDGRSFHNWFNDNYKSNK